jgi:competence protein ComEC
VFDLGQLSLLAVAGIYAILFGLTISGLRLIRSPASFLHSLLAPQVSLAALGIGVALTWSAVFSAPDGRLHLALLEAGPPVTLLIQSPDGRTLLINGGSQASLINQAIGQRLPLFDRKLDSILVANADKGTFQTLPEVLASYPAGQLWWALSSPVDTTSPSFSQYVKEKNLPVENVQAGQYLDLGRGARLEALAVGETGAILLLSWENFRALLPVGLDLETLDASQDNPRLAGITALLLADRGSAELNPPEWIRKLNPQVVLLSGLAGDQAGPPDPVMLEAVQGHNLLRTDQNGWIELMTDGEQLWGEVEKR